MKNFKCPECGSDTIEGEISSYTPSNWLECTECGYGIYDIVDAKDLLPWIVSEDNNTSEEIEYTLP